jgi:hypothetical protein
MDQQELIAGDSLNFPVTTPDHPASAGFVLHYRLAPLAAGGGQPIDITATAEGAKHRVAVAASVTADWAPGEYNWARWVDKAGEIYTVGDGQVTIKPNPRTMAAGYDGRSLARKALADARAAFAAWSPTQRRYKIGEREREFQSPADIIKVITYWEQQVESEDIMAGRAEKIGRRIYSRI